MTALFKAPANFRHHPVLLTRTQPHSLPQFRENTFCYFANRSAHLFNFRLPTELCKLVWECVPLRMSNYFAEFCGKRKRCADVRVNFAKILCTFYVFRSGCFFAADVLLWAHFLHQVAFFFSFTPLLPMMISYVCVVSLFFCAQFSRPSHSSYFFAICPQSTRAISVCCSLII